jgi:hypothetical protein
MESEAVEPVPSWPVTVTSWVVQFSSPAVAVELRSASPMNDREEMSEAADAFQRSALKDIDPAVHD